MVTLLFKQCRYKINATITHLITGYILRGHHNNISPFDNGASQQYSRQGTPNMNSRYTPITQKSIKDKVPGTTTTWQTLTGSACRRPFSVIGGKVWTKELKVSPAITIK